MAAALSLLHLKHSEDQRVTRDRDGGSINWLFSIFSGRQDDSALKSRLSDLFQDLGGQRRRLEDEKHLILAETTGDPYSALENLDRVRRIHAEMERIESSSGFLRALIEERTLNRSRLMEVREKLRNELAALESQSRQLIETYRAFSRSPVKTDVQARMRTTGRRISSLREQDHILREILDSEPAA